MRIAAVVALWVLVHQSARAQGSADPVARHRAAYQLIEGNLKRYQYAQASREKLHLEQRSLEGGELEAYCDGSELKKIFTEDDGETFTGTTSFYYDHDSLLFVFIRNGIGHMSTSGDPYPKRTEWKEERLYFADGKLIRWLGNQNKPHDVSDRASIRHGADIRADGDRYHDLMAGCKPTPSSGEPVVDEDLAYQLADVRSTSEATDRALPSYRHVQGRTDAGTIDGYCDGKDLELLVLDYESTNNPGSDYAPAWRPR